MNSSSTPAAPHRAASRVTLVLGGARSGKSAYAEALFANLPPPWLYVATAEAGDGEMRTRIEAHRSRRGADWQTLEAPLDLADAMTSGAADRPALIDCLTLWLSNLMHAGRNIETETSRLIEALGSSRAERVLVANEVGLGIVPDNALARAFRDEAGRLNQRIASAADRVVFVAAGLPIILKG